MLKLLIGKIKQLVVIWYAVVTLSNLILTDCKYLNKYFNEMKIEEKNRKSKGTKSENKKK